MDAKADTDFIAQYLPFPFHTPFHTLARRVRQMPRAAQGPRIIDSTGIYYAVRMFKGKKRFQSLQTRNKAEAMRRWPAAMQESAGVSGG